MLREMQTELEKMMVKRAVDYFDTYTEAAKFLGICQKTLYNTVNKHSTVCNASATYNEIDLVKPFIVGGSYKEGYKNSKFASNENSYRCKVRRYLGSYNCKVINDGTVSLDTIKNKINKNIIFSDDEIAVTNILVEKKIINNKGELIC